MASAATIAVPESVTTPPEQRILRLWVEGVRIKQRARLRDLPQLQGDHKMGKPIWEEAKRRKLQLPKGVRVDLPSAHIFGEVLGVFRSCATIKDDKMLRLELSVKDIAERIGRSKSAVAAALRWLLDDPIVLKVDGDKDGEVVAQGLGLIYSARRTGFAIIDGEKQTVWRTAIRGLTIVGRLAMGLLPRSEERRREKAEANRRKAQEKKKRVARELASQQRPLGETMKTVAEPPALELEQAWGGGTEVTNWNEDHAENTDQPIGTSAEGVQEGGAADADTKEVARSWMAKIRESLKNIR